MAITFNNTNQNITSELTPKIEQVRSNIFSVNMSSEYVPKYIESKSVDYVLNGKNHEFVKLLIELQDKSAIHHSITKGKAQMISGEGIEVNTELNDLNEQEIQSANDYIDYLELNDVLHKCATDYSILNYCFILLTRTKDKTAIAKVQHIDASMIAVGKKDKEGNITEYYYSNDWSNIKKEENKPVSIPAWDYNNLSITSGILMIKDYSTGSVYYPKPDYTPAINWILIDNQIGTFHHSNLKNGMLPSMWVSFNNGNPTEEEKEKIYDEIKSAYAGESNAGKIILTFSNNSDNAPTYQTLNPSDADKQFISLNEAVQNQILRSHRANPVLFVQTPGSLGQSQELRNASELFYNQVIAPIQVLFERVFTEILQYSGFEDVELYIKDSQPISFSFSEQNLLSVITKDEARQLIGYKPIQSAENQKEPLLIESIGIGGVQALQSIIADVNLTSEQKINSLQIIFGLTLEQAQRIVNPSTNPLPNTNTNTNVA